jgi:hypothetical protein
MRAEQAEGAPKLTSMMGRPREGDWFAVPVGSEGYVLGLVARAARRGEALFGYFFGPLQERMPSVVNASEYSPTDALLVTRFYNTALVSGQWQIVARSDNWDRGDWPFPQFHIPKSSALAGESFVVAYSEENPETFVGQRTIETSEERLYPPDEGIFPPSHVERRLEALLNVSPNSVTTKRSREFSEEGARHVMIVPANSVAELRHQLESLGLSDISATNAGDNMMEVTVFQRGKYPSLRESAYEMERNLGDIADRLGGRYDALEWALPP